MTERKGDMRGPCDHCGGEIHACRETSRGDHSLTYVCDACGCRWTRGMTLIHKGAGCPVHGRDAAREAVRRAARWLAEGLDAGPTPTQL